jgi:hypothetical protein
MADAVVGHASTSYMLPPAVWLARAVEDDGMGMGAAGLSAFVGNAVMNGDPCAWHDDADPASFPPSSPWVHCYGQVAGYQQPDALAPAAHALLAGMLFVACGHTAWLLLERLQESMSIARALCPAPTATTTTASPAGLAL